MMVKPKIESMWGKRKICAPMAKTNPPMTAPRKRRTCFWRDAPTVVSAVKMQVTTEVLMPGQLMEV